MAYIRTCLINHRAKPCPSRCAPARATHGVFLAVQNEIAAGTKVGHERNIRHRAISSRRQSGAGLPARASKKLAAAAPS